MSGGRVTGHDTNDEVLLTQILEKRRNNDEDQKQREGWRRNHSPVKQRLAIDVR
jgi:hypothetical protein